MAHNAFSQGTNSAIGRVSARRLHELAAELFDRSTNPRIHPRIFYLGAAATPIVARFEQWHEGPTLTYGALMLNGVIRLGHHVSVVRPLRAPVRPPCNAHTAPTCVEYAVTPYGVVGSHDNTPPLPPGETERDWDGVEQRNLLGMAIPRQYLLDTQPGSDIFYDPALGAGALAVFDGHMPSLLAQAITAQQTTSGQLPAA